MVRYASRRYRLMEQQNINIYSNIKKLYVKTPPINLYNIDSIMYLLLQYPILIQDSNYKQPSQILVKQS